MADGALINLLDWCKREREGKSLRRSGVHLGLSTKGIPVQMEET